MSTKTLENYVHELINTVAVLHNKVNSLEVLITEQNRLIKNLLDGSAVQNIEGDEGKSKQRPVRECRLRAISAVSAPKRKGRAVSNVSPAPSVMNIETSDVTATPTMSVSNNSNIASHEPENAKPTDCFERDADTNNEWVTVRSKRVRRSLNNVARGTAAPGTTELEAAERKCNLHLYYLKSGTTVEQVIRHLLNICPNDSCFVEQLKSRGDYASFKLTVPFKHMNIYMSPEHWAENVHIKPWRNGFRKEKTSQVS